ncbi:MAG TPA: prephenate dehydratase domain-containing protein [Gammaproteobacteria bacterium]|nr:prephenate dehydratase domain-containing protein [Gammaproteobacteria bacterium]
MTRGDCAFQGEPGAFSEQAARALLGPDITVLPCDDFSALFDTVTTGRARWAVVPMENTLAGPVTECVTRLNQAAVTVVGEIRWHIRLALIAAPDVPFNALRQVLSHPVALRQCRRFLASHSHIEAVAAHDTAGAVRQIVRNRRADQAAIAGSACAERYGGHVLLESIADSEENYTRFVLIEARAS